MPKFRVTVLKHLWAQVEVEADTADDAMARAAEDGATAGAAWETTLIDPVEVEEVTA